MNLTNAQKRLLLNLIFHEQSNISNMNENIEPLRRRYNKELAKELMDIYEKISDSIED